MARSWLCAVLLAVHLVFIALLLLFGFAGGLGFVRVEEFIEVAQADLATVAEVDSTSVTVAGALNAHVADFLAKLLFVGCRHMC